MSVITAGTRGLTARVVMVVAGATSLVALGMALELRGRISGLLLSLDRSAAFGCLIAGLLAALCLVLYLRPSKAFVTKLLASPSALAFAGVSIALLTDRPKGWTDADTLFTSALAGILFAEATRQALRKKTDIARRRYDDPIAKPKEDLFGRTRAIRSLYRQIAELDADSLRVALTGRWGAGKSSCLNLIRFYARRDGFPVTPTINAWTCRTRDELWLAFADAVDSALLPDGSFDRGPFWLRRIRKLIIRLGADMGSRYFSPGSAVGELLRQPTSRRRERREIEEILKTHIGNKRLLVLIDDLDRAEPDVAYEVLLAIKELVDLPHCMFVVAYDEDAVLRSLKPRYDDQAALFLEKVFNLFVNIEDFGQAREDLLEELLKTFPTLRLEDLPPRELLPIDNPRRLKTYLLRLAVLRGSAVYGEHLNWRLIFMAELARQGFPKLMEFLMADENFLKWIQMSPSIGDANPD